MKANEFVKAHGLKRIRHLLAMSSNAIVYCLDGEHIHVDDLKRLVKSHELVEYMGGIDKAKEQAYVLAMEVDGFDPAKIEKAIADVESCQ